MSGTLFIGNVNLTDAYGLKIGGVRSYQGVGSTGGLTVIPGRIGALATVNTVSIGGFSFPDWPDGLPNEIREYDTALYMRNASDAAVEARMTELRRLLLINRTTYGMLRDTYEPSFFRLARFTGDLLPERKGAGQNFKIPLRFSCDPRRYFANVPDVQLSELSDTFSPEESGIEGIVVDTLAQPIITIEGDGQAMSLYFRALPSYDIYGQIDISAFFGMIAIDTNDMIAKSISAVTETGGPFINDVEGTICLLPSGCIVERSEGSSAVITVSPRWWVR